MNAAAVNSVENPRLDAGADKGLSCLDNGVTAIRLFGADLFGRLGKRPAIVRPTVPEEIEGLLRAADGLGHSVSNANEDRREQRRSLVLIFMVIFWMPPASAAKTVCA